MEVKRDFGDSVEISTTYSFKTQNLIIYGKNTTELLLPVGSNATKCNLDKRMRHSGQSVCRI